MSRGGNPRITINADAGPVERAARQGEESLGRLEASAHKAGHGMKIGVAAGAVAATAGLGLLTSQVKESADAARESEVSQAKLQAQLKALGISYKAHAKQIDEVIQKTSRLSGLDDEDLQDAFTNVARATGNVNVALKDMGLVADIARAKHIDVAKAGDLVAKVHNGNVGVLKRYGVAFDPVTKAQDRLKQSTKHATDEQVRAAKAQDKQATAQKALAALTDRFSGQAKKYGDTTQGAMDKASVAWENAHEAIGAKVTPILAKAALAFVGLLDKAQAAGPAVSRFAGQLQNLAKTALPTIVTIFGRLKTTITTVISTMAGLVRGFQQGKAGAVTLVAVIAGATAAFTAYKIVIGAVAVYTRVVAAVTKTWTVAQAALNLVMSANPIGLVIVAIAGLAAGLTIAYKKSQTFRNIVDGTFSAIKDVVETVLPIVKKMMQIGLLGPIGLAITHFKDFKRIAGDAFGAVKTAAQTVADAINGIKDAISGVVGTVGKVGGAVKSFLGSGDGIGITAPTGALSGGNSLMGASPILAPFASMAGRFGLHTSSGARPGAVTVSGNRSYHADGYAIDEAGTPAGMLAYFRYLKAVFGSRLRELIYTPGGVGIKDGQPYQYTGAVAADHYDHVHVAFTGGLGDGLGRIGRFIGDGIGDIRKRWVRDGGDPAAQDIAGAVAMAESGGDPTITHRNSDGSIDRGLFQINSVHGAMSTLDRDGNTRAAISISSNGRNWRPWTTFTSGAYKRFLGGGSSSGKNKSAAPRTVTYTAAVSRPDGGGGTLFAGAGKAPDLGTGPAAAGRTYTGALENIGLARAESEGDKQKTLQLLFEEAVIKRQRLNAIKKALKGRLRAETRSRLIQEATGLVTDLRAISEAMYDLTDGKSGMNADGIIGGTAAAAAERAAATGADSGSGVSGGAAVQDAPTQDDFLSAAVARAGLTPDTADDIAALTGLRDYRWGKVQDALATEDPRDDAEAIDAWKSVDESLKSLTGSIDQANELQQQRDSVNAEILSNQGKILALANQGPAILAAVVAAVNGGIGGTIGLGSMTPGYAGGVANYGSAGRL